MSSESVTAGTGPSGAENEGDIRPVVAGPRRKLTVPFFIVAVVIVAVLLFSALDARRRALTAPTTRAPAGIDFEAGSQVPDLFIPPEIERDRLEPVAVQPIEPIPPAQYPPPPPAPVRIVQEAMPTPPQANVDVPEIRERPSAPGRVLVYDRSSTAQSGDGDSTVGASVAQARSTGDRARAGRLSNPATTVVQGTVIPAVLETALDTTRPGQARAIVTQDVFGFDGSRVLIPRGSRLIGVYQSDLAGGQNRVLVAWTRLVRPDGATIALDSQSADRLGRAGIRGRVNSHFWEQVGSALFRTTLDIGTIVASQELSGGTGVVFLPESLRRATNEGSGQPTVQRTLRVRQGAPVSVFVARDLDFSPVENGR